MKKYNLDQHPELLDEEFWETSIELFDVEIDAFLDHSFLEALLPDLQELGQVISTGTRDSVFMIEDERLLYTSHDTNLHQIATKGQEAWVKFQELYRPFEEVE